MRFHCYILRYDKGFAPNPFHRSCTLACCKPAIRRSARVGDWVLGITPKHLGNRLAYAMRVDEVLSFAEYFRDERFGEKKPSYGGGPRLAELGDNCYEPLPHGGFRQLPSVHFDFERNCEDPATKAWDLSGERALVSRDFGYFGAEPLSLGARFAFMIPARFNRVNFSPAESSVLEQLVASIPRGVRAPPRSWRPGDDSWRP